MSERLRIAILLAGGVGARMGAAGPKQLLHVGGRSILLRSIETFVPLVDQLLVVMAPGHLADADAALAEAAAAGHGVVTRVIEGGATRGESTWLAVDSLRGDVPDDAKVLVHDAVRPLVDGRIIGSCLTALDSHDMVTTAVASTDTVAVLADGAPARVDHYLPRHRLVRIQTPQGFGFGLLRRAHESAAGLGRFDFTDDCQVVAAYAPGEPVVVVEGDERNLKVTRPADLAIAEALLATGDQTP